MKKYFFLLFGLVIAGLVSCVKSSAPAATNTTQLSVARQAAVDDSLIQLYIAANKITATKDPSGLYYQVVNAGTGAFPTVSSTVNVTYTGSLLNGSVFAPTAVVADPLNYFIQGWQIGVPHINTKGTILLLIPSALGYGNNSPGAGIPANAVLVFNITLNSFM